MSELLPCPFCGGEAELIAFGFSWEPLAYGVQCIADAERGLDAHGHQIAGFGSAEKAIAAWNSRAERTCKQEERGWGTEGDHARVWLTCGHDCMVPTVQDLPNYCPNCGAKVKDVDNDN